MVDLRLVSHGPTMVWIQIAESEENSMGYTLPNYYGEHIKTILRPRDIVDLINGTKRLLVRVNEKAYWHDDLTRIKFEDLISVLDMFDDDNVITLVPVDGGVRKEDFVGWPDVSYSSYNLMKADKF